MESKIEISVLDTDLVIEMIDVIKTLKENGVFFCSAIELDHSCDGEEIYKRIEKLIEKTNK
jgi:hypothetical protein